MSAAETALPVRDGEAQRLLRAATPLATVNMRYLRKAIRYRLGLRGSPPSRYLGGGYLRVEEARELDRIADWIVQAGA